MLADDYYALLLALRPTGPAWPADDDHLRAMADGLARAHNRALGLLDEADPRTTLEMLGAWERNAGLPDECTGPVEGLEARRARLVQQITGRGGQSRAFYTSLAEGLGYPGTTIKEYRRMTCRSRVRSALNPDPWVHAWRLNVPAEAGIRRMTSRSRCNERLRTWGNAVLECVIRRLAPAHTNVLFSYGSE
jgi:uncharacterized protein YmfQ (DUF2313 family)